MTFLQNDRQFLTDLFNLLLKTKASTSQEWRELVSLPWKPGCRAPRTGGLTVLTKTSTLLSVRVEWQEREGNFPLFTAAEGKEHEQGVRSVSLVSWL